MSNCYDKRVNICRSLDSLESERDSTNAFITDWLKGEKKKAEIMFNVDGNTTRYTFICLAVFSSAFSFFTHTNYIY